ncbi:MAG TPA: DUF3566 domain-containing protein [Streptosporangiaceae bacterium]
MDHRTEPPSWLSGAAAVGTGADPPDADTDDKHDGGQAYQAGNDNGEAPAYGGSSAAGPDFASPDFGNSSPGGPMFDGGQQDTPSFGEIATGAHDFSGVSAGGHGFADNRMPDFNGAPDRAPDFGATHGFPDAPAETPDFSAPPGDLAGPPGAGPAYGGQLPDSFDGQAAGGFGAPADVAQGFTDDQRVDYGAGDYHQGDYRPGGFSAPPPLPAGDQFGATPYGGPQAFQPGQDTFQPGQENGVATPGQAPPFPSQYPPVEPPGSRSPAGKMTASLRTVRRPKSSRRRKSAQGRQAQLTIARFEPWSVMKFSFVISLVAFIVFFVAVALLYAVLSGLGVFSALQHTVSSITSSQSSGGFSLSTYLSASRVLGYTGLLGAINVVLITALSTVGSVLYNITADLAGGVEITLKETD